VYSLKKVVTRVLADIVE